MNVQIFVAVVEIALIAGSVSVIKLFLNNRKDIRIAEISGDANRELLALMRLMNERETRRIEIIADLLKRENI
ncbi:hypothetical protein JRC42_19580 [Escherichia albertii]|uniref:hypothetical protein n=1 Tax=Escherichia albertii TaxID=208962 RepID=UPI00195EFD17|nr:hypothetical protein [Escherichia albertii]QST27741.1 hypothetical protein JRC42_19580 [Escherichia albertii]QST37108.1 hypothetical protein JRC46_19580 [Escherichia albertii]